MKNLIKFAAVLGVMFSILSCEKHPVTTDKKPVTPTPEDPKVEVEIEYTEDIMFSLEIVSVESTRAEIKVTHTGTKDDTWYGFATTSTNVNAAIRDKVKELTGNDDEEIKGLINGTSKTLKLDGLEPDTKYACIVFAMTAEGEVYGEYGYEVFTTKTDYKINKAWEVCYSGRAFIGENEYENTISVTSSDNNQYFMTVVQKDRFDQTDIKDLLNEELTSFKEFIDQYNEYYGLDTKFKDWCYTSSAVDAFGIELGYTYIALAIGADDDGNLTGLYAVSEEFQPYEEEMSEAYASWLGNWTFTGANGVAFNVTFEKEKSNKTFVMTGWEGDEARHCKVIVDWYGDSWIIWSQYILSGTDPYYGDYSIYFCPVNSENGKGYIGDYPMCIGTTTSDGSRMVGIYQEEGVTFTHMQFIAEWPDGLHPITRTTKFPTFPITVTPGPATTSTAAGKSADVRRNVRYSRSKDSDMVKSFHLIENGIMPEVLQ